MTTNTARFRQFEISLDSADAILTDAIGTPTTTIINTINAHSFNIAQKDQQFLEALTSSDYLAPDGVGIILALRFISGVRANKVSGYELFQSAMKMANDKGLTVGFLGSSRDQLEKIDKRCAKDYPDANVKTLSPPFQDDFTPEESLDLLAKLGSIDILFVGMTAPKQEKFVHRIREALHARAVLSIGAVFDFYSGTIRRPHPFFIKLGLEWLGRSIADPKKLGKRNLIAIPTFVWNCVKKVN